MIDAALIAELRERIVRTADWEYFFDGLTSPDWAEPLFEAGIMGDPYGPIYDDQSYFQLPAWPPSRYLARVARSDPAGICSVAARIPETANTRVHQDLISVFVEGSEDTLIAQLAVIQAWLHQTLVPMILLEPGVSVLRRLAELGQLAEALDFLHGWLSPPQPDWPESWRGWVPSQWEYGEVLDRSIPVLAAANPLVTLGTLVELMASLLDVELGRTAAEDPSDGSSGWRSAIEDHEQNRVPFEKTTLLCHVRDVARMAARGDCDVLEQVVNALQSGRWRVFDRIAMNMVRESPAVCPHVVSRLLLDESLIEDGDVYHEYAALARDRMGDMSDGDQGRLKDRILAGPDVGFLRNRTPPEDEEYIKLYIDDWVGRRLQVIDAWLDDQERILAEELWQRVGRSDHPDFLMWSTGVMTGPNSPVADEVLDAMSVDDLLEFLTSWEPETGFMLPSREGLGRALARTIQGRPEGLLSSAERFIGQRPNYVRAVFDAVRGLLGGPGDHPSDVEWEAVLRLAAWVMEQPKGDTSGDQFEEERSWLGTRREIAHIVDAAIRRKRVSATFAPEIWLLLERLLEDDQPTPEFEAEALGPGMDPATLAINTVRGTAVGAAFTYLSWEDRRELDSSDDPVVLGALDNHLLAGQDQSLAVRSVFGAAFPAVYRTNRDWASTRAEIIFPIAEEDRSQFIAAWSSYLAGWMPGRDLAELLRKQYELAIMLLGAEAGDQHTAGSLSTRDQLVGHHLGWLIVTGSIPTNHPLVDAFYLQASPELRSSVVEFLGRTFLKDQAPSPEVWDRLIGWWEFRKSTSEASGDLTELGKFGWWTGAAGYRTEWFLSELEWLLRTGVEVDAEYFILGALAQVAPGHPIGALACLRLIEAQQRTPWAFYGQAGEVEAVLAHALAAGGDTSRSAQAFIDLLAAKGEGDFSALLEAGSDPSQTPHSEL